MCLFMIVNNFQTISAAITRHKVNEDHSIEVARLKEELHSELVKHDQKLIEHHDHNNNACM